MLNLNYNIIGTLGKGVETISPGGIQYTGVNYLSSGSTYNNGGTTFTIERNYIAIGGGTEILVQNTITSSINGGLIIEYEDEFQVTASISGSKNWQYSSSFQALTMSLSIPEIGFYITSSNTASIISASFGNNLTTFRDPYTITASVELEPYPSYSLTEFVFVGGGGNGGAANGGNVSGGGGGAGAIVSGSGLWIYSDSIYTVSVGGDSSFVSASIQYIKAAAGGNGGSVSAGGNGGNGGGGSGDNGGFGTGSIVPTGSAITNISSSLGIFVTASVFGGNTGGGGAIVISGPTPPQNTFYNPGGGGGATGNGQQALTILQGRRAGGAGLSGNPYLTGSICTGGESGASPAGLGGTSEGVNGDNATTIGSGGGGAKGGTTPPTNTTGGSGGNGIAIIRYLGPQKGRGGVVTTDGDYIIHTFYQSGLFYSTANQLPKQH
jgi:hypothetical protein